MYLEHDTEMYFLSQNIDIVLMAYINIYLEMPLRCIGSLFHRKFYPVTITVDFSESLLNG